MKYIINGTNTEIANSNWYKRYERDFDLTLLKLDLEEDDKEYRRNKIRKYFQ